MKKVAVIILNWNGERFLREFLPSVVANTPDGLAQVVVADNGSTDGSLELLRQEFPTVRILSFPTNLGYAGGYNRALEETPEELVVLLNSDVSTPTGWLAPMVAYMEEHPKVAAVQPKILSYRQPTQMEYAGACGGYLDCNGYPYCRGRIFGDTEADHGQYDTPSADIFWATGAALMVRRELYLQVGGLDTKFFAHMEEIDLCWRLQLAGWKVGVVPQSMVYHLGGGSLPASDPRKTYLNFRNNLLLLHKNLPRNDVRPTLLRRRLLDTVALGLFLLKGQWGNAKAVIRAHRDFRKMRCGYTDHPERNILRELPTCRRNILLEYYLKGHKHFSELQPQP